MEILALLLALPFAFASPAANLGARGASCGVKGYDQDVKAYFYSTSYATSAKCGAHCAADSQCDSYALGNGACLHYYVGV